MNLSCQIYSFGGCQFIEAYGTFDKTVHFTANDFYTSWGATVIENGLPDSSRSVKINISSSGQGQTFARSIETTNFVYIPVGTDQNQHLPHHQYQECTFSSDDLNSRSPQFINEYTVSSNNSLNLGGQLSLLNEPEYPNPFNSGTRISLPLLATKNSKTSYERFQNPLLLKHNNWRNLPDRYLLSTQFYVEPSLLSMDAKFLELKPTEIKVLLENTRFANLGNAWFQDPWYLFSNGNQPGNYWHNFQSLYEPTGGEGVTGKGVFLDQGWPNWNPPYYSVQTTSPQTISINGRNHTFYFQNWTKNNTDYQDSNAISTGVVFQSQNSSAAAVFKGHHLSNQTSAFNTTQRKLHRLSDEDYFTIYESMNRI